MKEKSSQIERIKAILDVLHELPVDEEADQRVSEFLAEQVIASCDSPEEDKAWEYIEHVYNRKQATCLAMQFTGENLEEILAFMTEHTDGDWNVQSPDGEQEAFTIVENPLWARSKILFNSCWVVIFSSSKMKIMREEIFKREWE